MKICTTICEYNPLHFGHIKHLRFINENLKEDIISCIEEAKLNKDSVGGIIETAVLNLEGGIGEPFFDSIESVLSHLIFSIPAVKGIEFGKGFALSNMFATSIISTINVD